MLSGAEGSFLAYPGANFQPKADPRQYNPAGAAPGCFAPNIPAHPPSCFPPHSSADPPDCLAGAEAGKGHFAKNVAGTQF